MLFFMLSQVARRSVSLCVQKIEVGFCRVAQDFRCPVLYKRMLFTPKTLVKVLWYRVTGFFLMLSVVKCRQITSTVINYHVGWTISRYVT